MAKVRAIFCLFRYATIEGCCEAIRAEMKNMPDAWWRIQKWMRLMEELQKTY
jgi:hypothetical protein